MSDEASVNVGQMEDLAHPIQRYLLPFQSVEQVLWVIIPVPVFVALLYAYDNLVESGRTSFHSWIKIAFTSFVCALPAWIPLLPMRFLIRTNSETRKADVLRFLKETTYRYGYKAVTELPHETVFGTLRKWLVVKQNTVRIAAIGTHIAVTGPRFAIRYLHKVSTAEFGTPANAAGR
jgi:hypothetical protein